LEAAVGGNVVQAQPIPPRKKALGQSTAPVDAVAAMRQTPDFADEREERWAVAPRFHQKSALRGFFHYKHDFAVGLPHLANAPTVRVCGRRRCPPSSENAPTKSSAPLRFYEPRSEVYNVLLFIGARERKNPKVRSSVKAHC